MNKPFFLLRLPQLALLHVLKNFNTIDLVDISFCSKVTKRIVKKIVKKPRKLLFFVDGEFEIWITFRRSKIIWTLYSDEIQENPNILPYSGIVKVTKWSGWGVKTMERSYEMSNFCIRNWLNHLMELFNLPVNELTIRDFMANYDVFDVKKMMDGLKIQNIRIGYFIPDCYVQMVLETVQPTKKLYLPATSSIESPENIKFNMDELKIESSHWLTFDYLLTINCRIIDLGYSTFSNENLHLFLKSWKNGSNQVLEILEARSEKGNTWNKYSVLDGLDGQEESEKRTFYKKSADCDGKSREITFDDSVDIFRDDSKSTIVLRTFDDYQSSFMFLVWPKSSV